MESVSILNSAFGAPRRNALDSAAWHGYVDDMRYLTYVGSYTDASERGIHVLATDTERGELQPLGSLETVVNSTYLTLNRGADRLYALQKCAEEEIDDAGELVVYEVRGTALRLLDRRRTLTGVPCHISLSPDETALVFAEYGGARVGAIGLRADGAFADPEPVVVGHHGHGPDPERQTSAHAHCAMVTPDGRWLCVADLGLDRVVAYDFRDWRTGLRRHAPMEFRSAPGAGPRHLCFPPAKPWGYLLNELDNTVVVLAREGETLQARQTLSTLPREYRGDSKAAAIHLSTDGRFLLTSNRGHDSIAVFAVDSSSGRLTLVEIAPLRGRFPRDFRLAPDGRLLLAGHKLSNEIGIYAFDPDKGHLSFQSVGYRMHKPTCVVFGAALS